MNIQHDNSMYTTLPPQPIATEQSTPLEMFKDAVEEHLYEQKTETDFIDLDEIRNCELIQNEQIKAS